jgi:hypothetical protein
MNLAGLKRSGQSASQGASLRPAICPAHQHHFPPPSLRLHLDTWSGRRQSPQQSGSLPLNANAGRIAAASTQGWPAGSSSACSAGGWHLHATPHTNAVQAVRGSSAPCTHSSAAAGLRVLSWPPVRAADSGGCHIRLGLGLHALPGGLGGGAGPRGERDGATTAGDVPSVPPSAWSKANGPPGIGLGASTGVQGAAQWLVDGVAEAALPLLLPVIRWALLYRDVLQVRGRYVVPGCPAGAGQGCCAGMLCCCGAGLQVGGCFISMASGVTSHC